MPDTDDQNPDDTDNTSGTADTQNTSTPDDPDTQNTSNASDSPDQYTSTSPTVTMTENNSDAVAAPDTIGGAVGDVVNAGKFAWDVMKDNRPVFNTASDNANALPPNVNFTDLNGWAGDPHRMVLHYHTENRLGSNTTDLDLICEWYYNGNYQGAGQYINAAVIMVSGTVAWGSTVNITATISNPMNSNGVAVLPVRIALSESNIFQNFPLAISGELKGDGSGHIETI